MKRLRRNSLLNEFILCVVALNTYFIFSEYVYARAFRNDFAVIILANIGVVSVLHMIRSLKKEVTIRSWGALDH